MADAVKPVCYQCGARPARRLTPLPAPYRDRAIYCSLACAAVDALQACARLNLAWDAGWPGGWSAHEPEGMFIDPARYTPAAVPCRFVVDPARRVVLLPHGWSAESFPEEQ